MKSKLLATTIAAAALFAGSAFAQTTGGSSAGGGNPSPATADTPAGQTGTTADTTGTMGSGSTGTMGSSDTMGTTGTTGSMGTDSTMGSGSTMGSDSTMGSGSTAGASDSMSTSGSMGASDSMSSKPTTAAGVEAPMYQGQALDNQQIMKVQQALADEGQDIEADGIWGPNTKEALRTYQESNDLEATGELDEETVSSLGIEMESEVGMGSSPSGTSTGSASGMSGGALGEGATNATPGEGSDPSDAQLEPEAADDDAPPTRDLSTSSGGQ